MVAQKYEGIWTTLLTGDGYGPLLQQAHANGAVWVNHSGAAVTGADLNIMFPHYQSGYLLGQEAGKWLEENFDGEGEAAVTVMTADENLKSRTTGFEDGLDDTIPGIKIWEAGDDTGTQETGAAAVSSLLQTHPDIRVMFAWTGDGALGMMQAAAEAGKTDASEVWITAPDAAATLIEKVEQGTPIQTVISVGFPFSVSAGEDLLEQAMEGKKIPPTGLIRPTLVTQANAAEELAAEENPRDPKYVGRIENQLVLVDTPVVFNGPLPDVEIPPITPNGE
jgi:ABC-type sugar transport system substrate-binding protein